MCRKDVWKTTLGARRRRDWRRHARMSAVDSTPRGRHHPTTVRSTCAGNRRPPRSRAPSSRIGSTSSPVSRWCTRLPSPARRSRSWSTDARGLVLPVSQRATTDCDTPRIAASPRWDTSSTRRTRRTVPGIPPSNGPMAYHSTSSGLQPSICCQSNSVSISSPSSARVGCVHPSHPRAPTLGDVSPQDALAGRRSGPRDPLRPLPLSL